MAAKQLFPGFFMLTSSQVNLYLFEDSAGLVLIDTGVPGSLPAIETDLKQIGRDVRDINRVIVTHLHPDHAGSLAEVKQRSGARAAMHPLDAAMIRAGTFGRPTRPSPGLLSALIIKLFIHGESRFPGVEIEDELADGQLLPIAGGLRVIHAPGHTAGQVVLLWEAHKLLVCADTCVNFFRLNFSPIYEDFDLGKQTLKRMSALDFDAAVFSHGQAILRGASQAFRRRFS